LAILLVPTVKTARNKWCGSERCTSHKIFTHSNFLKEERSECIPSRTRFNISLKHIFIDYVDVADVKKYLYKVKYLSDLFTNVAEDTVLRLTRRVSLVEQELLTLPEHLSSPLVFSGVRVTRSLVLYVCFVDRCLSFCTFSSGHCVVCSSSIFGFWYYPFGIFKLFFWLLLWYLPTFLSLM